jgi:hypothetical protein
VDEDKPAVVSEQESGTDSEQRAEPKAEAEVCADNTATARKVCAHWMTYMFRYGLFLAHSRLIG